MTPIIYFTLLFAAKVLDNALGTAKTIFIQHNHCILAGLTLILSDFIYFLILKNVVTADSVLSIIIVSVAGGVGCCLAVVFGNKFSKDRTFVNVIMCDDKAAMQKLRDFLAKHHIINVATDSYTLDWQRRTITITAYAETKAESRLIEDYIENSPLKFKRVIQKI